MLLSKYLTQTPLEFIKEGDDFLTCKECVSCKHSSPACRQMYVQAIITMRDVENLVNLSYRHFKRNADENPFEFDCHCNKYEKKEGLQIDAK